jgi:hypothetical protein
MNVSIVVCEPECPNTAIYEELMIGDTKMEPN